MNIDNITTKFIYEGLKIAAKKIFSRMRIKKEESYLFVITNRKHILNDVEADFGKKSEYHIVRERFSLEGAYLESIVDAVIDKIRELPRGSNIFILCTLNVLSFMLGHRLHHSGRNIFFMQFDLDNKQYRIYKIE